MASSQPTASSVLEVPLLSHEDSVRLSALSMRGTPSNTLRAYERDLVYIKAWKQLAFGQDLRWPEDEAVVLRFVLDHSRDLSYSDEADRGRQAAQALIDMGLRRTLACPSPATLDRRIASWQVFHRVRNLRSPFKAPVLRQARAKGRQANARPPSAKSANVLTRDAIEDILQVREPGTRGLRDMAIILTGWACSGRCRPELAQLMRADVDLSDYADAGIVRLHLERAQTKTLSKTPRVLKGRTARMLVAWIDHADITGGPLFRAISRTNRVMERGLSAAGIVWIVRSRLQTARSPEDSASAQGSRSGPLAPASFNAVDVASNPPADLPGKDN